MTRIPHSRIRVAVLAAILLTVGVLARWWAKPIVEYASLAQLHNANDYGVTISYGDSLTGIHERVGAASTSERFQVLSRLLSIEREVVGADPIEFALGDHLSIMGEDVVLALFGTTLFVVARDQWSRRAPTAESELRALATRIIPPLD